MVFSLVILLAFITFIAFFVGKNLSNVCTFWIFKTYTDLPVAVLALICFGAGIVVSILVYLLSKLKNAAEGDKEKVSEGKKRKTENSGKKSEEELKTSSLKDNKNLTAKIRGLKIKSKKNKKTDDNQNVQNSTESQDVQKDE